MLLKFKMRDGAPRGKRAISTRDVAEKTRVAVYNGAHYIAEREGEDLVVYAIGDDDGIPGVRTSDKRAREALNKIRDSQAPIKAMQQAADKLWGEQRAAQEAVDRR